NRGLLRSGVGRVDGEFRLERLLVRVVDAGEVFQLSSTGFLVQALRIALFAGGNRRIDENLDERQLACHVQGPDSIAVLAIGADEAGHGDHATVGKKLGDFADAADVFLAVGGRKPQVLVEAVADVVAVQNVGQPAALHQGMFQGKGNRALAGAGK